MSTPTVIERIAELRALLDAERAAGRRVGFVPTMGFLHEGHARLMRRARAENDLVVVSIFVNPLQFGPTEDLAAYPRDLDRDLALCGGEEVAIVFHPGVEEMYPERDPLTIKVGPIGGVLCGRTRPGHFDGVATVVAKLFNIAGPCRAYFGEKDAQQAALVLSRALGRANDLLEAGERSGKRIEAAMAAEIGTEPLAKLDYAACVDPDDLAEAAEVDGPVLLAVAAWVGKARLIDNMTVYPAPSPDARTGTSDPEASIAKG